jgi:DNA gyrase subunit A
MAMKDEDFVTTLFVANTHTPILFFSTDGMVYKLKTWRLPQGARNARGRPVVNVLPVEPGVGIAAILPVDVPEEQWERLQIVFVTSQGDVRRNRLSDFTNVMRNGKIAMKLPEGVKLIGARICDEEQDVLLTTAAGRAIRFRTTDVRVFQSRDSTGVRGVKLLGDDAVVSMAVLRRFEMTSEERQAYLKMRRAVDGAGEEEETTADADEEAVADIALSQERYAEISAAEETILTITSKGLGKRTSSHEYPLRGRGGQGVTAANLSARHGDPDKADARIVAAWPVGDDDQVMLVTDRGQSIRCPVDGVRVISRGARGVRVLNVAPDERVVSVALIAEAGEDEV